MARGISGLTPGAWLIRGTRKFSNWQRPSRLNATLTRETTLTVLASSSTLVAAMSRLIRHILALSCLSIPLAAVCADDPSYGARSGVLLLRNGELISGEITQAGDHYDVALRDGEIHVRVADVEAVCRDLQDCYAVKRGHVAPLNINDQLALGEWCLRHRLLDEARRAFEDATAMDATHPKLALLERRLKFAVEPPRAEEAKAAAPVVDQPSGEDLDRAVHGLPPRAVEYFTTHVQPMLLNHCSTAGCHGPQSVTSFQLLRLPSGRTGSRRSTQRNLYSALALINRDQPSNSPLLTAPASAHGTTKSPIFGKHQANQYRQLVEWVYLVSSQKPEPVADGDGEIVEKVPGRLPPGLESARPLARRRGSSSAEKTAGKPAPAAARPEPSFAQSDASEVTPAAANFPTDVVPPSVLARKPVKRGVAKDEFVPKDEFDAEMFNRQQPASRP